MTRRDVPLRRRRRFRASAAPPRGASWSRRPRQPRPPCRVRNKPWRAQFQHHKRASPADARARSTSYDATKRALSSELARRRAASTASRPAAANARAAAGATCAAARRSTQSRSRSALSCPRASAQRTPRAAERALAVRRSTYHILGCRAEELPRSLPYRLHALRAASAAAAAHRARRRRADAAMLPRRLGVLSRAAASGGGWARVSGTLRSKGGDVVPSRVRRRVTWPHAARAVSRHHMRRARRPAASPAPAAGAGGHAGVAASVSSCRAGAWHARGGHDAAQRRRAAHAACGGVAGAPAFRRIMVGCAPPARIDSRSCFDDLKQLLAVPARAAQTGVATRAALAASEPAPAAVAARLTGVAVRARRRRSRRSSVPRLSPTRSRRAPACLSATGLPQRHRRAARRALPSAARLRRRCCVRLPRGTAWGTAAASPLRALHGAAARRWTLQPPWVPLSLPRRPYGALSPLALRRSVWDGSGAEVLPPALA